MYFGTRGGRIYRNPIIEAMRLSVTYDDLDAKDIEWPLPDYWPVIPSLDMWRAKMPACTPTPPSDT